MRKWLPGALLLGAYAFSLAVYSRLPERVATHWGPDGPDGWSSRAVAAFLMPTIALACWLLMRWLPSIDPRRDNYSRFRGTYDSIVSATVAFLVAIHVVTLGAGLGWPVRVERLVPAGVGILFVVIGNVLPRARQNWFFGIRTPWTLSSTRVWERTHRVGGYVMAASGVALLLTSLLSPAWTFAVIIVTTVAMAVVMTVYSYLVWRAEQGGSV